MFRGVGQLVLAAWIFATAATGCTRSVVQQKTPPDPLLISKKPISGKYSAYEPAPRVDLAPPALPTPVSRTVNPDWSSPAQNR